MFRQSAAHAGTSLEPPLTHPGAAPESERAKQPPLPEPPYTPYSEPPTLAERTYKPYTEKPAPHEPLYEPYKGM